MTLIKLKSLHKLRLQVGLLALAFATFATSTMASEKSCHLPGELKAQLKISNAVMDMVWDEKLQQTVRGIHYYDGRFDEEIPSIINVTLEGQSVCKIDKAINFELKILGQLAKVQNADDGHGHGTKTTKLSEVEIASITKSIANSKDFAELSFLKIPILAEFRKLPKGRTYTSISFVLIASDGAELKKTKITDTKLGMPQGD